MSEDTLVTLFVGEGRLSGSSEVKLNKGYIPEILPVIRELHRCVVGSANISHPLTRLCRERLAAARSPRDLTSLMSFNPLGFATLPPGRSLKDNALVVM